MGHGSKKKGGKGDGLNRSQRNQVQKGKVHPTDLTRRGKQVQHTRPKRP